MKQKTAMQQIFERINLWLPINDPLRMELESDMAMWLEKEKQQIMNARINGDMNPRCISHLAKQYAELYYLETYGGDQ